MAPAVCLTARRRGAILPSAASGPEEAARPEALRLDPFGTFSEFALALAGFAAIALVLGQRQEALPPGAVHIVRFMVVNALGPALLSLLAGLLVVTGFPRPLLWQLGSGAYLAVAVFFGLLSLRQERELARSGELAFGPGLHYAFWTGTLAAHGIQAWNLLGLSGAPSAGLFLVGLWVLLLVAAVQFVALLFSLLR